MLLQQQFVKVPLRPISDIQQYRRIPYHLLFPRTTYIHRAPRHMITRRHSPRQPIHLRRPIPRINHNPLLFPRLSRSPRLCSGSGSRSPHLWRSPRVWRQSGIRRPRVWRQSTVACDFTLGPDPSIHRTHPSNHFTLGPDPSNHRTHPSNHFTSGPDPSNHSQLLQPPTNALQILNHDMRRNIPIRRHILRLTHLPERKVLRQFHTLIHFHLIHFPILLIFFFSCSY